MCLASGYLMRFATCFMHGQLTLNLARAGILGHVTHLRRDLVKFGGKKVIILTGNLVCKKTGANDL